MQIIFQILFYQVDSINLRERVLYIVRTQLGGRGGLAIAYYFVQGGILSPRTQSIEIILIELEVHNIGFLSRSASSKFCAYASSSDILTSIWKLDPMLSLHECCTKFENGATLTTLYCYHFWRGVKSFLPRMDFKLIFHVSNQVYYKSHWREGVK